MQAFARVRFECASTGEVGVMRCDSLMIPLAVKWAQEEKKASTLVQPDSHLTQPVAPPNGWSPTEYAAEVNRVWLYSFATMRWLAQGSLGDLAFRGYTYACKPPGSIASTIPNQIECFGQYVARMTGKPVYLQTDTPSMYHCEGYFLPDGSFQNTRCM